MTLHTSQAQAHKYGTMSRVQARELVLGVLHTNDFTAGAVGSHVCTHLPIALLLRMTSMHVTIDMFPTVWI